MATDRAAILTRAARATAAGYGAAACHELDEAAVVREYAPMVKRIAAHLKGRLPETVQIDDLIQAGMIAVLRLMRQGTGVTIRDLPLHRTIVNAMIDEARRETWAPVRTVRLAKTAAQAMRTVKSRLGRDGSDEEIASEMGLSLDSYHSVLVEIAGIRMLHLDTLDEQEDVGLQVVEDRDASLDRSRVLAALASAIAALPEREKLVVSLYYEHELNMDEVGKVLGFDKSTVCRAHGRALLMLRAALADTGARPSTAGG